MGLSCYMLLNDVTQILAFSGLLSPLNHEPWHESLLSWATKRLTPPFHYLDDIIHEWANYPKDKWNLSVHQLCISTSKRVLRTPFAGQNNFFDAKTIFSINFHHKMFKNAKKPKNMS